MDVPFTNQRMEIQVNIRLKDTSFLILQIDRKQWIEALHLLSWISCLVGNNAGIVYHSSDKRPRSATRITRRIG